VQKLLAGYSKVFMASVEGVVNLRTMGGDTPKFHLMDCPTHSPWFEWFLKGCLSRMGQVVKQDMAISLPVMHALLCLLEEEWQSALHLKHLSLIASVATYALIAFLGSFWSPEVFLTDLFGLKKYQEPAYEGHFKK
jgi:hypothetical protein